MSLKRARLLVVPVLGLAVVSAACSDGASSSAAARPQAAASSSHGSSNSTSTGSASGSASKGRAAVTSPAATTRSVLTAQLQEHVYLAGIATGTALGKGPDSEDFKAAAATLDANSVALAKTVTSVYGDAGGKQFLDLWRKHIGFFVEYTVGAAKGDKAMKQAAVTKLDGYRSDFGAFLESATEGQLTKSAVEQELVPHIQSLAAAVDAQAAKSPRQFALLQEAASHMSMTAEVLAGAIAEQKGLTG